MLVPQNILKISEYFILLEFIIVEVASNNLSIPFWYIFVISWFIYVVLLQDAHFLERSEKPGKWTFV